MISLNCLRSPLDSSIRGEAPDDRGREHTLVIRFRKGGFFSNFNGVLNNLCYRLGRGGAVAAVVDWSTGDDKHPLSYGRSQDDNLWPRLFEPLPFHSFPDRTIEVTRFFTATMTGRAAYAMYKLDLIWRRKYHAIYQRYIRVRPSILDEVEALYGAGMAGVYCAGVHYRHPEHDQECLHPVPAPEAFVSRLRRLLPSYRPWVVFLATDLEPVVEIFQRAFGPRLVIQPGVHRAASPEAPAVHDAKASEFALAKEVLIDTLLLARCDLMLHVTSNVATAAGYINPSLRMVYCESAAQAFRGYIWSIRLLARKAIRRIGGRPRREAR
jgi:hypothetical protein